MSLSEQTTTSGAYCFRNHVYAWTLYLNFFLTANKNKFNKLGGKNPPQI